MPAGQLRVHEIILCFINVFSRIYTINRGNSQSNDANPRRYGVKDNEVDQSCSKSFTGFMSPSNIAPSGAWSWIEAVGNSANTVSNRQASV